MIQVFLQFGAIVERASIDEAYIDLTNLVDERLQTVQNSQGLDAGQISNTFVVGFEEEQKQAWLDDIFDEDDVQMDNLRLAIGAQIVEEMRAEVFKQTQFRCSAGIAHNKGKDHSKVTQKSLKSHSKVTQ